MAKIVLGKRPETITAFVDIPLMSGEKAKVSCQFKYRTRQEFAKFLDENAEAKPEVGKDGEKITFESLAVKGMASNAARALEFVQARGRSGHAALHAHHGIGRGRHRRQLRAVLEVAGSPAALHQHHRAALPRQLQRRHHEEAGAAVHLAVLEVHRVLGQPAAFQDHRAVEQRLRFGGRGEQGAAVDRGQAAALVQLGLQRLLLRGARQLPAPQGSRHQHAPDSSQRDQPEAKAQRTSGRGHGIMRSMKYLIVAAFIAILASLASALFFMMRNGQQGDKAKGGRMAKALALRVGLSIVLFLCILAAWQLGYIQPTGLPLSR